MLENCAPFSFADLVERVSPAVVTITSEDHDHRRPSRMIRKICPSRSAISSTSSVRAQPQQPHKAISAGSGFIIDKSGDIVTNNHVVENGKKITVKLPDGREFDAKLVGTDQGDRHRSAQGQSRQAAADRRIRRRPAGARGRLGDRGRQSVRPFQFGDRRHRLVDRPRHRKRATITDFIQIDAPINRGNSGGPTFDLRGQVIGMNSMIFSPSGGSVGIGFAIPAMPPSMMWWRSSRRMAMSRAAGWA